MSVAAENVINQLRAREETLLATSESPVRRIVGKSRFKGTVWRELRGVKINRFPFNLPTLRTEF
jgi:hypothetical protein